MKNILLPLTVINLIFFTSCKDDKNTSKNLTITDSSNVKTEKTTLNKILKAEADVTKSIDVPKFEDSEIQKYIEEYDAFIKEYLAAAKAKDMTKLGELNQKGKEWDTKIKSIAEKLKSNPDNLQKFNEYIKKLNQEIVTVMIQR